MKYLNMWQDYSYKKSNMTRKKEKNLGAIIISIIFVALFGFMNLSAFKPKEKVKDNIMLEAEARDRERVSQRLIEWNESVQAKVAATDYAYRVAELNENFTKGDWIIITWWRHPETTYIAPKGTSCTGQITKIVEDKVYGTWGDNALTYGEEVWHRCSQKEYLEARKKEQLARDKANKPKKQFVSWGLHPSMRK